MKKIFTSVATMIVTSFIMRVIDRIKNPQETSREELHEELLRKKQAYEEQKRARPLYGSTPRGKDAQDAVALALYSGLDFRANRDQELMQAEARRWDGPKVAPEGCAIGSCNGR